MDRERLDRWCERGILALVLSILVFGPLAFGAVRALEFIVIQALTSGVIFLWILRLWLNPRPVLFWPPISWAALAFVIYAIIRYQLAPIEYVARIELIKVLVYAFLFFGILNNLSRQESTQVISLALIFLAFALAGFGIFQVITKYDKVWGMIKPAGYVIRASGTFINPNIFAGFLEMILPVALAYTLIGRFSHTMKIVLGYVSLVLIVALGATLSRGGWISSALVLVVFFGVLLFQRDFRLRSIIVLALLLALGIGAIAKTQHSKKRFKELVSEKQTENDRRIYWGSAVQIWQEDIWLGAGPGHYDYRFRQYRPPELQDRPQYVHNDYINTLADWGIAGLSIIACFIALFYLGVFKTWRFVQRSANDLTTKKSNKAAFVFGGSLGVLAILFHSVVDFNMQIPANAILLLTLVALVTTYLRFATERFWASLGIVGKSCLTLIGCAGLLYFGQQAVRQTQENLLLARAAEESEKDPNSERRMDLLKEAFAVDSANFQTAYEIGEMFRVRGFAGNRDYESLTQDAMKWFQRSIDLNPYYPFSQVRYGMCLDWLGRTNEASACFDRAKELDPNGYFTTAHQGWHLLQLGDLQGAKEQFERSQKLMPNPIAESYLEIIEQKLAEPAL